MRKISHFIHFSRPHTVLGTVISITSLFLLAGGTYADYLIWIVAIIACLGTNIYIVGLNQLTDISIDKVNKPYLPLASGAYTRNTALEIISVSILISLGLGIFGGEFLLATLLISIVLGTIYSLPPVRLKRFHFWAAFCIIAIRGLVVNLLIFLHFTDKLQQHPHLTPVILLLTGVIFIYSIVIAWFKDIPDMSGDKEYEIKTLSLIVGAHQVFRWGNAILLFILVLVIGIEWFFPVSDFPSLLIIGHLIMALILLKMWITTSPTDAIAIKRYYLFIWLLFYLEYILFGLSGALS